jgi:hypothetical protein
VGVYIRLLCYQWCKGFIPDDDQKLQRITLGTTPEALLSVRHKFVDGVPFGYPKHSLINLRLELERKKQTEFRNDKAAAGKIGGLKRASLANQALKVKHTLDSASSKSQAKSSSSTSISTSSTLIIDKSTEDKPPVSQREFFKPPSSEEVKLDFAKRGLPEMEADKFMNYYGSNGWKVGKNRMKDWQKAAAGWKLRWDQFRGSSHTPTGSNDERQRPNETYQQYERRILAQCL